MKTKVQRFRLTPVLDEQIRRESKRLGMNISEFVRYALTLFFDDRMDRSPQSKNHTLVDSREGYEAES